MDGHTGGREREESERESETERGQTSGSQMADGKHTVTQVKLEGKNGGLKEVLQRFTTALR